MTALTTRDTRIRTLLRLRTDLWRTYANESGWRSHDGGVPNRDRLDDALDELEDELLDLGWVAGDADD